MNFPVSQVFTHHEWGELTSRLEVSGRQAEIMRCLLEGMADKQVAANLEISTHTVRTYIDRMFAKLHVQDRNELVVLLFRQFRAGCREAGCPRCH